MDPVDRLLAIEEIKRLKARYFRHLDSQDWEALRGVFTADATFEMAGVAIVGTDEWITWTRSMIEGAVTVHHGHMPEIDILTTSEARGVWAMEDDLDLANLDGSRRSGAGHYHELYRRDEHQGWAITSIKLVRLRVDPGTASR